MAEPLTLTEALRKLRPAQALNTRQAVLDELLSHFLVVQETLWSSEGYDAGEETGIQSTIFTNSPSYRALDRLLRLMRNQGQQKALGGFPVATLYWHLGEWYFRSQRFPVYAPARVIRERRRGVLYEEERRPAVAQHTIHLRRHKDVRADRVKLALDWLDVEWPAHVGEFLGDGKTWPQEPFVPDEILEAHLPGDEVIRKVRTAA